MSEQVPNPGVGGSYLYDPDTGELTLIPNIPTQEENGTNSQKVPSRKRRGDLRDRPNSNGDS